MVLNFALNLFLKCKYLKHISIFFGLCDIVLQFNKLQRMKVRQISQLPRS